MCRSLRAEAAAWCSRQPPSIVGDRVYPYPILAAGLGGFSEYILVPDCEVGQQVHPLGAAIASTSRQPASTPTPSP